MAAKRDKRVQDQYHGVVKYHILHWAHREAGAKMRGVVTKRASHEPLCGGTEAQLFDGELGMCLRVGSTASAPGPQEE